MVRTSFLIAALLNVLVPESKACDKVMGGEPSSSMSASSSTPPCLSDAQGFSDILMTEDEISDLLRGVSLEGRDENSSLIESLGGYKGFPSHEFYPRIANKFPGEEYIRVAVVGGRLKSGLGQMNDLGHEGKALFFLINRDKEEGLDYCLDWTTPDLPAPLYEQFHVIILEQVEVDTLISSQVYTNSYLALKGGGLLLFNTYRPSDYFIAYHNLYLEVQASKTEEISYLEALYTAIEKDRKGWTHLQRFFESHLRKAGFSKMYYNPGICLTNSYLFNHTPRLKELKENKQFLYNSSGWAGAVKKIEG